VKDRGFTILNYTLISIVVLICLYPFLNVVSTSFSSNQAILAGNVSFFPVEPQLGAYRQIIIKIAIWKSMAISVIITLGGTIISLFITTCAAYALSKEKLKGREVITGIILFTMYFNGGIVPLFLVVKQLHLLDTLWSLVLPHAMNAFNFIVMRTFFRELPESLEEAAAIDGCNEWMLLLKIVLPLSKPIMVTIGLFYAVELWNNYFNSMMYITNPDLFPLQMRLRQIIFVDALGQNADSLVTMVMPEALKAATIVISTLPILIVYPWLQKHVAKGVMTGAVKG